MQNTVKLDIVSLEAKIFSGRVTLVVVTGEEGELGIMPGHTQLLTSIKPGQVMITTQDGTQDVYYISGGMLEVQPHEVTVLADTVIHAEDLDEAAALKAEQQAKESLQNNRSDVNFTNVLAQLAQATAKLRTIKLSRKNNH